MAKWIFDFSRSVTGNTAINLTSEPLNIMWGHIWAIILHIEAKVGMEHWDDELKVHAKFCDGATYRPENIINKIKICYISAALFLYQYETLYMSSVCLNDPD